MVLALAGDSTITSALATVHHFKRIADGLSNTAHIGSTLRVCRRRAEIGTSTGLSRRIRLGMARVGPPLVRGAEQD